MEGIIPGEILFYIHHPEPWPMPHRHMQPRQRQIKIIPLERRQTQHSSVWVIGLYWLILLMVNIVMAFHPTMNMLERYGLILLLVTTILLFITIICIVFVYYT